MIVTRMDGGLGNQMFQYAFGLYLAHRHQSRLVLDLGSFQSGPQHGYMLDRFQITARPLSESLNQKVPKRYRSPSSNELTTWLPDWLNSGVLRRIKERPFGFDEKYLKSCDNSYLVGYWQSEKFFPGMRGELLKQFTPTKRLCDESSRVIESMQSSPSVSLHIRRGDYINNPATAGIYEQVSLGYYRTCVERFAQQHDGAQVYVFSNDLDWCRRELQLRLPTRYIDHTDQQHAYEDLVMMSHACCNVIANSTFSWWAAYLNDRPDQMTFAPTRWFRPGTLDGTHLYRSTWQQIDATQNEMLRAA